MWAFQLLKCSLSQCVWKKWLTIVYATAQHDITQLGNVGGIPSFSAWSYIHTYNINTYVHAYIQYLPTYIHTYIHTYYGLKIVWCVIKKVLINVLTWRDSTCWEFRHLPCVVCSVNKPSPKTTEIKLIMFVKGNLALLQHAFTRLLWLEFCYFLCRWQFKEQEIW